MWFPKLKAKLDEVVSKCIVIRYFSDFLMPKSDNLRRPSPPLSNQRYQALAAFRKALREFLHFSEEAALEAGVAPQQHQAMLVIRASSAGNSEDGIVTIGDLAAQLQVKHQSAVGLVNRMEAAGLVRKTQDAGDRRRMCVRLSKRGHRLLEKLAAAHAAELARVGPALRTMLKSLGAAL